MTDHIEILAHEAVGDESRALAPRASFSGAAIRRGSRISEAWDRATEPSRLRPLELAVASACFALVAVAVYLPHLLHGGWYSDDWGNAAIYRFAPGSGFIHEIEAQRAAFGTRPLLWVDKAFMFTVFGMHPRQQLALAVALAALVAAGFFALLRMLRLASLPSFTIAALTLVFPWSDSTHLWATASLNQLALLLYLAGILVAFAAFDRRGRQATLLHGVSLVLYAAALLTYEAVVGLIVMSVLLYWVRTRGRSPEGTHLLLRRWLADCAVAVIVLAWSASSATNPRPPGIRNVLGDVVPFSRPAAELVVRTLWPIGPLVAGVALIAVIVLLALRRGFPKAIAARQELSTWCWVAALALVAAVFAFGPLVGSGLTPTSEGINNRGNLAVALPLCAFVFAVVAVLTRVILPRRLTGGPWMATVVAIVLVIGGAYVYDIQRDITRWDRASALQGRVLTDLRHSVPRSPSHSVLFAYGAPAYVSRGIPVFAAPWDLRGAIKIALANATIDAYPIAQGVRLVCGPTRVYPLTGPSYIFSKFGPAYGASYGRAIIVNLGRRETQVLSSASACKRLTAQMHVGPTFGSDIG